MLFQDQPRVSYTSDQVYTENDTANVIFVAQIREMIDLSLISNQKPIVMLYGDSGAGKTFTAEGALQDQSRRGLIFSVLQYLISQSAQVKYAQLLFQSNHFSNLLSASPIQIQPTCLESGFFCRVNSDSDLVRLLTQARQNLKSKQQDFKAYHKIHAFRYEVEEIQGELVIIDSNITRDADFSLNLLNIISKQPSLNKSINKSQSEFVPTRSNKLTHFLRDCFKPNQSNILFGLCLSQQERFQTFKNIGDLLRKILKPQITHTTVDLNKSKSNLELQIEELKNTAWTKTSVYQPFVLQQNNTDKQTEIKQKQDQEEQNKNNETTPREIKQDNGGDLNAADFQPEYKTDNLIQSTQNMFKSTLLRNNTSVQKPDTLQAQINQFSKTQTVAKQPVQAILYTEQEFNDKLKQQRIMIMEESKKFITQKLQLKDESIADLKQTILVQQNKLIQLSTDLKTQLDINQQLELEKEQKTLLIEQELTYNQQVQETELLQMKEELKQLSTFKNKYKELENEFIQNKNKLIEAEREIYGFKLLNSKMENQIQDKTKETNEIVMQKENLAVELQKCKNYTQTQQEQIETKDKQILQLTQQNMNQEHQLQDLEAYKTITWEMEREIQQLKNLLESKEVDIEQLQNEIACIKAVYAHKRVEQE
ncbi:Conserved_hypothetical protein [Hexamita inflata]|uniref:Kinesin motor domain-containing protein n=1 Tax=Hexamita inflata TaxID=28002 RepID=A0ABP1HPK5_9EUKA